MKRSFSPCSEGQRQLCALQLSQREIAAALGTSHQNVARWQSSPRAPGYEIKLKIAEAFGIPAAAWDQAPVATNHTETLASSLAAKLRDRADAVAGAAAAQPLPDNAEQLDALIEQLRNARAGDVAPVVLVKLAAAETRALQARERMRTAVELACKHPDVIAWGEALADKLNAHPLAILELCLHELKASATAERVAQWEAAYASWRERHAPLVEAAEAANAALAAVLPPGASFERAPDKAAA